MPTPSLGWGGKGGIDPSNPSGQTPWGGEDEQGEEQLTPGTAHTAHQHCRAQPQPHMGFPVPKGKGACMALLGSARVPLCGLSTGILLAVSGPLQTL